MKIARHAQIIKLINQYDIETQEELAKKLEESGFAVTQATISRDIRQLKLTKVPKENGGSRYAVLQNAPSEVGSRYARVLKDAFISVDHAKNILVIKTVSGMAMAAAAAGATSVVGAAAAVFWAGVCAFCRALAAVACCPAHWSKHARRASLSLARLLHCCQPGWLGVVLAVFWA